MKNIFLTLLLSGASVSVIGSNTGSLHISALEVNKGSDLITLNMTVDAWDWHPGTNEIVELTPMLVSGADTLPMTPLRIAGKKAWIVEKREKGSADIGLFRVGGKAPIAYTSTLPFDSRFERSQVVIKADTVSVCNCREPREGFSPVAKLDFSERAPQLVFNYVAPKDSAEKTFELSGKANIVFKVNRTEIDWSYAGNRAELDTILKTINVVRDNKDATVQAIYLCGYASPEGSYANNVRLAAGRTVAVRDYVASHSSFPASIYHTSSVPEDWEGLLEWLKENSIPKREEMIKFIETASVPVAERNDIFRSRFPEEYPYLLANVYPGLRHTDYKITYQVRKYYDVAEIKEVMKTNPRNLSLNELFLLANSLPHGSLEYDEVFELAARLYPDSEVANLNAANSAMNRKNFSTAEFYLGRAGDNPQAIYARALLLCMKEDYAAAEPLLIKAKNAGIHDASKALEELKRIREFKGEVEIL